MKNFFKNSLLTAILLASFGAFAKDDMFSLKVNSESEKSIVFFINETNDINLSILTSANELVYEQKIHAVGASKKTYNLQSFPDGEYVLKLETSLKRTTYNIVIEDGKALISVPTVKEIFKPALVKQNQMVTLNLKNEDNDAVEVSIVNEHSNQLFLKSFTKTNLSQRFDISKTDAKEVTFVVRYKGEEYSETFKVN